MGGVRTCLTGFRYDAASSFERGAADGPPAVREALWSSASNLWSESRVDLGFDGALTDVGDEAWDEPRAADAGIARRIGELLALGQRPIALGGDHSITYPIVRTMRAQYASLTIVHFDAHPDLYDEFEGSKWSHACPFARIMESRLADRLVQIGLRAATEHQREQAARFGVQQFEMSQISNPRALVESLGLAGPVYCSVDLDALDPSCAPGVAHIEPGGLSTRDLLTMIQSIGGDLVGADVVELNPHRDVRGITATAAAKIVKELAGRMISG